MVGTGMLYHAYLSREHTTQAVERDPGHPQEAVSGGAVRESCMGYVSRAMPRARPLGVYHSGVTSTHSLSHVAFSASCSTGSAPMLRSRPVSPRIR